MATSKLTWLKVRKATPGMLGDGGGLWLHTGPTGGKSWIFRYTVNGRRHDMGLGSVGPLDRPTTSLDEARDLAQVARQQLRAGRDPLVARREQQAADRRVVSFVTCAQRYIEARQGSWSQQHREQFRATLDRYVLPAIGDLPVETITTAHVTAILQPHWLKRTVTMGRVRDRIGAILDFAATMGWRSAPNVARWKGHLENILPARQKVAPVAHLPALPWQALPSFFNALRAQSPQGGSLPALALQLTILTAARTGEVLGANWSEFDLQAGLWCIPADRMKSGRPHRVPLAQAALDILQTIGPASTGLVFAGGGAAGGIAHTSMRKLLRRMGRTDFSVHGCRSSFRDFCGEHGYPRELAELALAHSVGDRTEASYFRTDLVERRRLMMQAWADHCTGQPAADTVVALRRA